MSLAEKLETLLSEIGLGRWQVAAILVTALSQLSCPVQQMGSTLLSAPVPFRCSYVNFNQTDAVFTGQELKNNTPEFPSTCLEVLEYEMPLRDNISLTELNMHYTGLPSCPFVEYDRSVFKSTVVTEWDLICESLPLRPLFQMTFPAGSFIGSLIAGGLSDKIGRKKTIQIGCVLIIVSIIASGVVPWYTVMLAMKIIVGIANSCMLFPGYTLISEISPAKNRATTSLVTGMAFFFGLAVFPVVAYLIPHWRMLFLICNLPYLLPLLLLYVADESPRWLLQQGRNEEAISILKKGVKQNGADITSTSRILDELQNYRYNKDANATEERGIKNKTAACNKIYKNLKALCSLYTSPGMRTILIASPSLWFFLRTLYLGIAINTNNFTRTNKFEYVAISGGMGMIGLIISMPLSYKLPRKVYIAATLFISGFLMLVDLAVPSDLWIVRWIMVMVAFCLICGSFQVNYIFAAELYPTSIRTSGFTLNNLAGCLGEISVPLVTDIAVQYQWWAASFTFGLAGIMGSLHMCFLPETKDKPMPEIIQDVEIRYWRDYKRKPLPKPPRGDIGLTTAPTPV